MGEPEKRKRDHRKAVSFSADEWEQVERRMSLAGARSFEAFARSVILTARVDVRPVAFDVAPLRAELARIGNNVNQIARNVNINDGTTMQQMVETRRLIQQVQQLLTDATGRER